jgi:hypothetical protein
MRGCMLGMRTGGDHCQGALGGEPGGGGKAQDIHVRRGTDQFLPRPTQALPVLPSLQAVHSRPPLMARGAGRHCCCP